MSSRHGFAVLLPQFNLAVLAVVILSIVNSACQQSQREPSIALGSKLGAEEYASHEELPEYPQKSISSRVTGLAVASVLISTAGRVTRVSIIQAPDEAISASVKNAVWRWRFSFDSPTRPYASGKLYFYFTLAKDGVAKVLQPKDFRPK